MGKRAVVTGLFIGKRVFRTGKRAGKFRWQFPLRESAREIIGLAKTAARKNAGELGTVFGPGRPENGGLEAVQPGGFWASAGRGKLAIS